MILLIWVIRFIVYGALAVLSLGVIAPAIGGSIGLLLTAPLAGLALAIDIFLTAKMKSTTVDKIVSSRLLIVDSVLSGEDKSGQSSVPELETEVVEVYRIENPPEEDSEEEGKGK